MTDLTYGKSMYGGWYAQTGDGKNNIKTDTLKELRKRALDMGLKLVYRYDN